MKLHTERHDAASHLSKTICSICVRKLNSKASFYDKVDFSIQILISLMMITGNTIIGVHYSSSGNHATNCNYSTLEDHTEVLFSPELQS